MIFIVHFNKICYNFSKKYKDADMKYIFPDYYNSFKCIADQCQHSCCIGWEIDIDDETLNLYNNIPGAFGERLRNNIEATNESTHFKLQKNDRCPFLNQNGLCDIITNLGEGALCQICDDHPRFRNYFSDRIETGLGLCCEAAAEIILTNKNKTNLIVTDDGEADICTAEEMQLLKTRDNIFQLLQNREYNIYNRIEQVLDTFGITLPDYSTEKWSDFFKSLERLDNKWDEYLSKLKSANRLCIPQKYDTVFEQLCVYFAYRHIADSIFNNDLKARISFIALSAYIIGSICTVIENENGILRLEEIIEICRMYSSEIEYSEENLNNILTVLT